MDYGKENHRLKIPPYERSWRKIRDARRLANLSDWSLKLILVRVIAGETKASMGMGSRPFLSSSFAHLRR